MKESLLNNLQQMIGRFEELTGLLSDPEIIGDPNRFRDLSQEYAHLEPVAKLFAEFEQAEADVGAAKDMCDGDDAELKELGREELETASAHRDKLEAQLHTHLIPKDPHENYGISYPNYKQ